MKGFDLLVEIALDTGTEKLSIHGAKTSSGVYAAVLDSVGDIVREIQAGGGVSPIQSGSFSIRDPKGTWGKKLKATPWKKRVVTIKLANLETGAVTTQAVAKIENASRDLDTIEVDFRDDSFDRLEEKIPLWVFPDLFPYMPKTTEVALIPIPLGAIDSTDFDSRGHIPAYLVDTPRTGQTKYRYVAAQVAVPTNAIPRVYREGELVSSSEYTVTYANVNTAEFGNVRMTFIDFDRDQREAGRDQDVLITYDCTGGLTDDGTENGTAITNVAAAAQSFLMLRGKVSSSEFDSTLQAAAESAYTTAGITAGVAVVDLDDSWLDVVDRFSEFYNLQLFRTRTGKFGMRFDKAAGDSSSNLPHFFDSRDTKEDFEYEQPEDSAATLEFTYAQDWARNKATGRASQNDSTEETALGREVKDQVDLGGIRDVNQGKKIAQIRLFQRRSSRDLVTFRVPPQPTLELGDHFKLTHFQGPSSDGLGYRGKVFQVLGLTLVQNDDGIFHEISAIDAPGLTLSSPADTEPGRTSQDIPPEGVAMASDVVWTPADQDTVNWSGCTLKISGNGKSVAYSGISSGNTGNMTGTVYVYFDPDTNTGAFQTTTSYTTATEGRKRLVAICQKAPTSTQKALVDNKVGFVAVNANNVLGQTTGDNLPDGTIDVRHLRAGAVTTAKLAAGAVTADEIAAGAVTATKISVTSLSAISAALGSITSGTVTGATIRTAATGARVVLDSSNYLQAYDANYKRAQLTTTALSFWDSSGHYAGQLRGSSGMLVLDVQGGYSAKIRFTDSYIGIFEMSSSGFESNVDIFPSSDNLRSCGTASKRWHDVRSVLINGADICLANGWLFRELGATKEDLGKPESWFREHCGDGIQVMSPEGAIVAVIKRDGIYARQFNLLN